MEKKPYTQEELAHIDDLIAKLDQDYAAYLEKNNFSPEEGKKKYFDALELDIALGKIRPVEGAIMLVALGYDNVLPVYLKEQFGSDFARYPQAEKVDEAVEKYDPEGTSTEVIDNFVANDFVDAYLNDEMDFDELIYSLAILGRIPLSDYLHKSNEERKAVGNKIDYYYLW